MATAYKQHKLASGSTLITVPMPAVKSVTVLFLVNTGSRYETPDKEGIAHFFEHIVFKGTEAFPTPLELSTAIDAIGAEMNAFTSKEYTGYYIQVASRNIETALNALSDMMLQPKLRQDDIDREKGVIIEEINMYRDNPMAHVENVFEENFYADRGLSHDIIGSKETISSITSQDFENFLSAWYAPENIIITLAGDEAVLQDSKTIEQVEHFFSKKPHQPRTQGKRELSSFYSKDPISNATLILEERKTEQAHIVLGWPGLSRLAPERHALGVFASILGGNMSSRLFSEVREKRGLCYYVHASTDYYHDTGSIGASAGVDPSRVYQALSVILSQFQLVASGTQPITAQELANAKECIAGKLILSLEDSQSVAQYYGSKLLLSGEIETPDEVLKKVLAVTLDEVNEIAQRLIVGTPKVAVIGPFADKAPFEEAIAAGLAGREHTGK